MNFQENYKVIFFNHKVHKELHKGHKGVILKICNYFEINELKVFILLISL